MLDACTMTIVRNGEDYLEPCILQVVDHVSTVKIAIDERSKDRTRSIAERMAVRHPNIEVSYFRVKDPLVDLVAARNKLLDFTESMGFILDSDEFHVDIAKYDDYLIDSKDAFALQCHAPWTEYGKAHKASARAIIGRIFRKKGIMEWRGPFGKEKLYRDGKEVFRDVELLPFRYLHFTHLKRDDWRTELRQRRVADGRSLYELPDRITKIIENIHDETRMQTVRGWK